MKKNQTPSTLIRLASVFAIVFAGMIPRETLSDSGKPAARMGDVTAHGGVIIAGCATVFIGGKPAARVGDMHTCPAITPGNPPIPHVGGSIYHGSPTVLIGGMPAARMGDLAICNGPPDAIVLGCQTVLIGTGEAGKAKEYSEDYIRRKYDKSNVVTQQKIKKRAP